MDKVRCPWCGAEMVLRDWHDIFFGKGNFYECVCGAKSPIKASPDVARAAAMQRFIAHDKQIDGVCGNCRWCVESDKTNRMFCTFHGDEAEFETFADNWCSDFTRRPTDEERAGAGWDLNHDGESENG